MTAFMRFDGFLKQPNPINRVTTNHPTAVVAVSATDEVFLARGALSYGPRQQRLELIESDVAQVATGSLQLIERKLHGVGISL